MNLQPRKINNVLIYEEINLDNDDSVFTFIDFWRQEFVAGQELFFLFFRLEDLTEDSELRSIKDELSKVFNDQNLHTVSYIDEVRFTYVFKYKFDYDQADLVIKFWDYFYGMEIIVPKAGINFESVCNYFDLHRDTDLYLKSFKAQGYADRIYLKGLGGDYLIKN